MTNSVFAQWDNPNIVYLGHSKVPLDPEARNRLERRGWSVALETTSILKAFRAIYENKASLLIVGDSPNLPAILSLRNQISDPIVILAPTLIISPQKNIVDQDHLRSLGSPELVESPLNPATFIESFEWLLRRWSQGPLQRVRAARQLLLSKKVADATKVLKELMTETDLIPLTVPSLAHFIRRQSDARAVEKILLNALKEHPRNLGIILVMVDFYIKSAMPDTALKIIGAAKKNHGNPLILVPEQIQALLMLNRVGDVIPLLESLAASKFMPEAANDFISRCLYAEGYTERFNRHLDNQKTMIESFQQSWAKSNLSQSA